MSRVLLLSLCLLLFSFLQACEQGSAQRQQKIGIVNVNRLMVDTKCGRAAAKHIDDVQVSVRSQLASLQKEAEGMSKLADAEKKAREDSLQREAQMAYARLQSEQQNVQNILNDVLHRTVETYRKAKGYDMILFSEVVLSFEEKVDVTSDIVAEMDKENVTFKKPAAEEDDAKASSDGKAKAGDADKPSSDSKGKTDKP